MSRQFRSDSLEQFVLPSDMRTWLPPDHLAMFVDNLVENQLDISGFLTTHQRAERRGRPAFNPRVFIKLLIYGACVGMRSCRGLEQATYDSLPFRVLAAGQHPGYSSIAKFHKKHINGLSRLFEQSLALSKKAGLWDGHTIAIDGSKFEANASKHKAMSYERMPAALDQLTQRLATLTSDYLSVSDDEPARYGRGTRIEELHNDIVRTTRKMSKIQGAMAALEQEAKKRAASNNAPNMDAKALSESDAVPPPSTPPADPRAAQPIGAETQFWEGEVVSLDDTEVSSKVSSHKIPCHASLPMTRAQRKERLDSLLVAVNSTARHCNADPDSGIPIDTLNNSTHCATDRMSNTANAVQLQPDAIECSTSKSADSEKKTEAEQCSRSRVQSQSTKSKSKTATRKTKSRPKSDSKSVKPKANAQRNFTDPDSRIMLDGATKQWLQAYNCQIAVDSNEQIILAARVTNQPNDAGQLVPMVKAVEANIGRMPRAMLADAGYFSADALRVDALRNIDVYVPPGRLRRDDPESDSKSRAPKSPVATAMRDKLHTPAGRAAYSRRKAIVEPVFGQLKERQKFRQFAFRGIENVTSEFEFECGVHNLLKVYIATLKRRLTGKKKKRI